MKNLEKLKKKFWIGLFIFIVIISIAYVVYTLMSKDTGEEEDDTQTITTEGVHGPQLTPEEQLEANFPYEEERFRIEYNSDENVIYAYQKVTPTPELQGEIKGFIFDIYGVYDDRELEIQWIDESQ